MTVYMPVLGLLGGCHCLLLFVIVSIKKEKKEKGSLFLAFGFGLS